MAASRRPSVLSCALVAVVVVGFMSAFSSMATAAAAGDPAAVAKVTNLNKKALEAYQQQDYDTARDLLKQALELCDSASLDQHPITARTHIHFGAVAIVGYKQRELGIKHFRKALEIQPDIKLTKSIATPELQDAFDEAAQASDAKGGGNASAGGDDSTGGGNAGDGDSGGAADDSGNKASADNDEGNAEERPHPRPRPRKHRASDEDSDAKDQGDDQSGAGQKGTIFVGLTIGSSFGLASGSGHLNPTLHKLSGPGLAPGQLGQIEPQLGFFLNPTLMLSLVGRLQYVSGVSSQSSGCGSDGTAACNPTTMAGAVLARATWLLSDGPFRLTFGGQVGGGYVVHAVSFPATSSVPSQVDAVLGGSFLIGPTVGFFYELGDTFNLVVALDTEIGAPKFTFNFDIDAGIGLRF